MQVLDEDECTNVILEVEDPGLDFEEYDEAGNYSKTII